MSTFLDPTKLYMINGQVSAVAAVAVGVTVGNNRTVLAGITGKRIRVMGLVLASAAAGVMGVSLKSASGGTVVFSANAPTNTAGNCEIPIVDSGYFETNTGEGLFADVATNDGNITAFYVTYTP